MSDSREGSGLAARAVRGFGWNYGATAIGKLSFFVATLVLARELEPAAFGVVAFTLAVLAYIETITTHGIGETLVYRSDGRDPLVASTAFWLSLMTSVSLMTAVWFLAPAIAKLGPDESALVVVVQILSLQLLLSSIGSTQSYLFRHSMQFNRMFAPQVVSGVAKGVVAIAFALAGFGVWSLVLGQLAGTLVRSGAYWIASDWRPHFAFARDKAGSLLTTGAGFAAVAIIGGAARNADYLIIGVSLGATALGYYYLAFRLPELLILGPFESAWQVLFSYYARLNDAQTSLEPLARGFRQSVRLGALVALPLGAAVAALATPIVTTLFGDAWDAAIGPFALISLWAAVGAVSGMAGVVLKSLGRARTLTIATSIATVVRLPLLWVATFGGISAVALVQLVSQVVWLVAIYIVVASVLRVSVSSVLMSIAPALTVSAGVGVTAFLVVQSLPGVSGLLLGTLSAIVVYAVLLRLVCADALRLGIDTIATAIGGRRRALSW